MLFLHENDKILSIISILHCNQHNYTDLKHESFIWIVIMLIPV